MNTVLVSWEPKMLLTFLCVRRVPDTQRCLQAVERLQARLKERGGDVPSEEKLNLLKSVLQSPLFHQILALQKSGQHLKEEVLVLNPVQLIPHVVLVQNIIHYHYS